MTAAATPIVTDNRCVDVVPVLAVCRPDWHLAKKWLQWAAKLQRLESLVLLTSSDLTVAQVYTLQQLAYRVASEVRIHHPNGFEEIGYFGGANQMFISGLTFCEEFFGDHAMLWIEADTCPMRATWFDEICHEWRLCERPFLGDVVLATQIPHMTGNAVYHPQWRKHAPSLALLPGPVLEQGWDSQCAHETFANCARSKTILQRWRPPAITEDWIAVNVSTDCALFHQCKDGTMIDVLTERLQLPAFPLERQLAKSSYPDPLPDRAVSGHLPRVEILIVTCARDADFLKYCLRGIREHASGFTAVKIVVPLQERGKFDWIRPKDGQVIYFDEPAGKGMMAHEVEKCRADLHCPEADFIMHLDADCIPFRRFTPADYVGGDWRALMVREHYDRITNPNRHIWKGIVKAAIGIEPKYECMVRHPQVHPRAVYSMTRGLVAATTGQTFEAYVLGCKNEFPQGFAEFPTLCTVGLNFAPKSYFAEDYDKQRDAELVGQDPCSFQYVYRRDRNHIVEFWSHGGIARYRSDIEAIFAGRIPEYWVK